MLSFLSRARKALAPIAAALTLAACVPAGPTGPSINPNAPVPVALLVPSGSATGGDDVLARAMENGARLAVSDLGATARIDLRVYSTGGSPGGAQAAAIRAADEGARIILGPERAEAANAVGVAMAPRGINVLSFSNNTDIAGGNVFVLGPTFRNTAERLTSYAARQGKRRIMIVHARDTAGEVGRAAIQQSAARSGASIVATHGYELSQNGIVQAVPTIRAMADSSGADVLFLTGNNDQDLPLLTQLLRENGVTQQLVGVARWDLPPQAVNTPSLQGGWFAKPSPEQYDTFQARYTAAFGAAPHAMAGLAYDGVAAIGALVNQGRGDALTGAALTHGAGFVGVGGIFRLRGDGSNERGLAVATIRNNQVVVIDAAPRSFAGAGF